MLFRIADSDTPASSEITPRSAYADRRRLMLAGTLAAPWLAGLPARTHAAGAAKLAGRASPLSTTEKPTSYKDVTGYNNFFEFGTEKEDPAQMASILKTRPWTVAVEGEVLKPRSFGIDELLKLAPMEERIYRLRCVEGWSMVIPWVGYPLAELIRRVEPTGNAKYVEFITLADKAQMPGLWSSVLSWPYTEGLRLDEAMHPLTLLTLGVYGEVLPNQNGAPVRLDRALEIRLQERQIDRQDPLHRKQPVSSWTRAAPHEYGFYSNVNPDVPHPRWSQATERRIGEDGFRQKKRKTLPFNGYGDQVSSLYAGMDLRKFF
jgi:sulfoxide reductase catalytic subunit YedY